MAQMHSTEIAQGFGPYHRLWEEPMQERKHLHQGLVTSLACWLMASTMAYSTCTVNAAVAIPSLWLVNSHPRLSHPEDSQQSHISQWGSHVPCPSPASESFIYHLLMNTWHRYCKAFVCESNNITKKEASLDIEWQALMGDGTNLSMKDIKKLPKVLQEALKKLALEHESCEIEQLGQATLEDIQLNDTVFELPDGDHVNIPWKEGVEDLSKLTGDELWSHLGLKEKKVIQLFQQYANTDAVIEPWTNEGTTYLIYKNYIPMVNGHSLTGAHPPPSAPPLLAMDQSEGGTTTTMTMRGDGSGTGKSCVAGVCGSVGLYWSVLGLWKICTICGLMSLAFITENQKWQGKEGNIPNLPFLVMCPVSLHHQWQCKIKQLLKKNTFDVLPYIQQLNKQSNWWTHVKVKSHQWLHWQIILATDTASQDNGTMVFLDLWHIVKDEPKWAPTFHNLLPRTVFGYKFLSVIINEAHKAHKLNKFHQAHSMDKHLSSHGTSFILTSSLHPVQAVVNGIKPVTRLVE
ncbi:hypothetical protein EDD15DRAFT_2193496 [Pisolithus albus]|nr:hypothetical protein EDD15DRAFT_2193496 [Pisolithus albus]